jgi:hypothetical protein
MEDANNVRLRQKRLDERMIGAISIELAMFMRWMEDNRRHMLLPPEAANIARKILDRENFRYSENQVFAVAALATASNVKEIDEFRKKAGFDQAIDGFCKSIGIESP